MYKIFLIFFILLISPLKAEQFTSIENFSFELPKGYMILNENNLYDVYNASNHDPILKKQMSLFKQRLQKQNVEILYNFNQSRFNNISIMSFNDYYKVNKKKVLKQCKKILKIEKKYGKRKVDLIECRMHDYPKFADWSMYRENESSFFENELTQQIIFMYKKKEYVLTVACVEKCNQMKSDLFNLVKSIKF
ncbi:hypothetical protein N9430_03005 [Candidatus Pelagibacter sp.]|nr:hypothetical protein [Candidatus Pelagibacter sp.]